MVNSKVGSVSVEAPSGGYAAGQMVLLGSLFAVVMNQTPAGEVARLALEGAATLAKVTGKGFAAKRFEAAYYDEDKGAITPEANDLGPVGFFNDDADGSEGFVEVVFGVGVLPGLKPLTVAEPQEDVAEKEPGQLSLETGGDGKKTTAKRAAKA